MSTSMIPSDRLSAAIQAAPGQTAIVAFITAGYPSRAKFREHLTSIGNAADVVEVGVPFTDPMADGVTIQRSSREALNQGFTLRWLLEELATMQRPKAPLVLMSYLNPLLAYGLERLAADAAKAGVCGFIVPDLPYDEGAEFRTALAAHGLALIQMVTPVTRPERMARLCASSQGFVYAVTMTGTTGRTAAVPGDVTRYLDTVRNTAKIPVCAGFGIRGPEQVRQLKGHVDGVIVGSALVELLESGQDPAAFLNSLRPG
jgi:tryptophan synthase alpha chain